MVVTGDGFARFAEPFAFRQISERSRIGQRRENSLLRIGNPAFGGIRDGQVQQLFARAAMRVKRLCEPILIQTPFCARGEHEDDKRPLELYHPCVHVGMKQFAFLSGQNRIGFRVVTGSGRGCFRLVRWSCAIGSSAICGSRSVADIGRCLRRRLLSQRLQLKHEILISYGIKIFYD